MNTIPLQEIFIPAERIRTAFNQTAIENLALSIASKGIIHPITLDLIEGQYRLIAGENRIKAVQLLTERQVQILHDGEVVPLGDIPFTTVAELDDEQRLELELEENVLRSGLSWQEEVKARSQLLELRQQQVGDSGQPYRAKDLAVELQSIGVKDASAYSIQEASRISKHLDNPLVAKAATKAEAEKIIRKAQIDIIQTALGEAVSKTAQVHKLLEGNSLELIEGFPDGSFSCILTDPPYGVGIDTAGSQVQAAHHYDDSREILEEILKRLPFELYRVTTKQAHLYWFCDYLWFARIADALDANGWTVWPRPLIWNKMRGIAPKPFHGPRYTYECILFANKGDRPTFQLRPDVMSYSAGAELVQAEKPKELLMELLARSTQPGDVILDPFAGSGSIFPAATALKCRAVGIELDPTRAGLAKSRLV